MGTQKSLVQSVMGGGYTDSNVMYDAQGNVLIDATSQAGVTHSFVPFILNTSAAQLNYPAVPLVAPAELIQYLDMTTPTIIERGAYRMEIQISTPAPVYPVPTELVIMTGGIQQVSALENFVPVISINKVNAGGGSRTLYYSFFDFYIQSEIAILSPKFISLMGKAVEQAFGPGNLMTISSRIVKID